MWLTDHIIIYNHSYLLTISWWFWYDMVIYMPKCSIIIRKPVGNSWQVYPQPLARGKGLPRVGNADPYPYPSVPYPKLVQVLKPLKITGVSLCLCRVFVVFDDNADVFETEKCIFLYTTPWSKLLLNPSKKGYAEGEGEGLASREWGEEIVNSETSEVETLLLNHWKGSSFWTLLVPHLYKFSSQKKVQALN